MSLHAIKWAIDVPVKHTSDRIILMLLASCYHEKTALCNPSKRYLTEKSLLTAEGVRKAIKSLVSQDLVRVEERFRESGANATNFYSLAYNNTFAASPSGDQDSPVTPTEKSVIPPTELPLPPAPDAVGSGGFCLDLVKKEAENRPVQGLEGCAYPQLSCPSNSVAPPTQLVDTPNSVAPHPQLSCPSPPTQLGVYIEQEFKQESKQELKLSTLSVNPTDTFTVFWSAYPRKVAKEKARQAWAKINPSEQLCADIMSALQSAKASDQWRRDEGRFIPHPATWLNGKRWEDEHDTHSLRPLPTTNQPASKQARIERDSARRAAEWAGVYGDYFHD